MQTVTLSVALTLTRVQVYGWECSQESNKIPGAGEELKNGGTLPADNRTWDVASMETSRSLCLTTIREFAEGTQFLTEDGKHHKGSAWQERWGDIGEI